MNHSRSTLTDDRHVPVIRRSRSRRPRPQHTYAVTQEDLEDLVFYREQKKAERKLRDRILKQLKNNRFDIEPGPLLVDVRQYQQRRLSHEFLRDELGDDAANAIIGAICPTECTVLQVSERPSSIAPPGSVLQFYER